MKKIIIFVFLAITNEIFALNINHQRNFRQNQWKSIVVPDNPGQNNAEAPPPGSQQNSGNTNTLVIPETSGNSTAVIPTEIVIVVPVVNASPQNGASATSPDTNSGNQNSTPNPSGTAPGPALIQGTESTTINILESIESYLKQSVSNLFKKLMDNFENDPEDVTPKRDEPVTRRNAISPPRASSEDSAEDLSIESIPSKRTQSKSSPIDISIELNNSPDDYQEPVVIEILVTKGVGVAVNQNGSPGRGPPNSHGPPGQDPAGPPGLRPTNPNTQTEEVNPDQISRNNVPEERMSMFNQKGPKNKFKRDLNSLQIDNKRKADCFNFGTPRSRPQTTTPSPSSTDSDDLQTSQRLRNRRRISTRRRTG